MTNPAFEIAVGLVLEHEGGYSDDPADRGGETKYGISRRSYPDEDIKNMTLDRAKDIYYNDFWLPLMGFELPDKIAVMVFDMAVNSGRTPAMRCLQRALGVKDDGWVGPMTKQALKGRDERSLLAEIAAQRIIHYTLLHNFPTFGLGWVRRTIGTLMAVVKD